MASCGGCQETWSGLRIAHCATDHHTFSCVSNYDLHITKGFQHLEPSEVGLVQNSRGVWHQPDERDISELYKLREKK